MERSLEAALLAEVNLAAQKVSSLLDELAAELGREARKISGPGDLEEMRALPPPAALPFFAAGGRLFSPATDPALRAGFLRAFGNFLEGREEVQQYDSVASLQGRRWAKAPRPLPGRSRPMPGRTASPPGSPFIVRPGAGRTAGFRLSGTNMSPRPSRPVCRAGRSGGRRQKPWRQTDPAFRDRLFRKAEEEGFTLMRRNVTPRRKACLRKEEERSGTVARNNLSRAAGRIRGFLAG